MSSWEAYRGSLTVPAAPHCLHQELGPKKKKGSSSPIPDAEAMESSPAKTPASHPSKGPSHGSARAPHRWSPSYQGKDHPTQSPIIIIILTSTSQPAAAGEGPSPPRTPHQHRGDWGNGVAPMWGQVCP